MNYVQNLISLVCNNNTGQVDTFIKNVMREEYANYSTRKANLDVMGPTTITPANMGNLVDSNNPDFSKNIISRLNTPFDHIERIVLQDFSSQMHIEDSSNYFKSLFTFTNLDTASEYGFKKVEMAEPDSKYSTISYSFVNSKLGSGPFFLDSFTYSSLIDYSVSGYEGDRHRTVDEDKRVGVYQDKFLTDYTTRKYDVPKSQVDEYRDKMTSTLFELGNLEKDIYDAKIAFRDSIKRISRIEVLQNTDGKVYIETFCQHLAALFAKLSNIRMSYEVYGFKHPHQEWEGILALDIWYQALYNEIDGKYPFNESFIDRNPMTRHIVKTEGTRKYIDCSGSKVYVDIANPSLPAGFSFADKDSSGKPVQDEHGYVLVWNDGLFSEFSGVAHQMAELRRSCVTPRGVLKKIRKLVYDTLEDVGGIPLDDVIDQDSTGDFPWFKQRGKVYSDSSKSRFSRYVNLHLGLAYEKITAKDYYFKVENDDEADVEPPSSGTYSRPDSPSAADKARMVKRGWEALYDAFCVLRNEHVFNIYNSNGNGCIEEFNPANANYYSQAQCAIVIERVFSRLYKYLQFKSTTGEVFHRHINIDSGYKYLTSDSIYNSDNTSARTVYYNDAGTDKISYLRYLSKIRAYKNSPPYAGFFTTYEEKMLERFIAIITRKEMDYIKKSWDLCPLCNSATNLGYQTPRGEEPVASERTIDVLDTELSVKQEDENEGQEKREVQKDELVEVSSLRAAGPTVTLTFRYMHETRDNMVGFQETNVNAYTKVPSFHIHQEIPFIENGKKYKYVFRYWKLEPGGNISSNREVLSNCTFSAVYDTVIVNDFSKSESVVNRRVITPSTTDTRTTAKTLTACTYLSSGVNKDGLKYCTFPGISPKPTGMSNGYPYRSGIECPYIQMLKQINGLDATAAYSDQNYDFDVMTLLQIDDISNLLKALFKINIDIAHREYYLKVDIPDKSDWWYGYTVKNDSGSVVKWVSFEPTVEYKFSNLHALNQVQNGTMLCTVKDPNDKANPTTMWITPVNRELMADARNKQRAKHFNDFWYCYDYAHWLNDTRLSNDSNTTTLSPYNKLSDEQYYYSIQPLYLYENSDVQSPVDVNRFVRHKYKVNTPITRSDTQVRTFTSIVKKYRPIIVPKVREIFNKCINDYTKYDVDVNNDYGVFGWCTIPSKTMVNMQYNEQSIIVPSSYDHHNRVGGRNFLQMDKDFDNIYRQWSPEQNKVVSNLSKSWYYLYDTRDWTYFLKPFFQINPNNDVFTWQYETFASASRPSTSDHLNGVIFEPTTIGRAQDKSFGDIVATCKFLAKYHHNEKNLKTLADTYTKLIPYEKLRELTISSVGEYNSVYGSVFDDLPENFRYPEDDWIDDFDKTGTYVKDTTHTSDYHYNLGQSHAIDDFDEDSVWLYITMTRPVDDLPQVLEIEDIMPFVFWWQNRGEQNNGPSVNCYGRASNAKLNYQLGGWCYSSAQEKLDLQYVRDKNGEYIPEYTSPWDEQKWHAVQHTMGVDFQNDSAGGTILTTDNSGNVYKGAFDPNCAGTDEKWKIHDNSNAFGVIQQEDPKEDKYFKGEETHGEGAFSRKMIPDSMNTEILNSITGQGRQMVWNLWNVVRHYAYIRYFKNRNRELGNDKANWEELERLTRKLVKGIYRTFKEKQNSGTTRRNFYSVDNTKNQQGEPCVVRWTNSFIEVQSILDRNAREHDASMVLYTGDLRPINVPAVSGFDSNQAKFKYMYETIQANDDSSFRVTTLDGVDSEKDGMRRTDGPLKYNGFKPNNLPSKYVLGDKEVVDQRSHDVEFTFDPYLDLDREYPYSEYYKNNSTRKWVRRITRTVMNRQILPVYTSMETMTTPVHDLSDEEMKDITFQVIPQLYWKYEWVYNEFMIHKVGKLQAPHKTLQMYDMLGNVWEWVRDDWTTSVRASLNNKTNPIATGTDHDKKVIKGGAFDQFCRRTISPSREGLNVNSCTSEYGTQANVGFRPSLVYTHEVKPKDFVPGKSKVDLFFLFDASLSANGQIGNMIESARKIVHMFAADTNVPDAEKQNICHVGSALFLGPQIRMMCSNPVVETRQRVVFSTQDRYWDATSQTEYENRVKIFTAEAVGGSRYEPNVSLLQKDSSAEYAMLSSSPSAAHEYFKGEFDAFKTGVQQYWSTRGDIPAMDNPEDSIEQQEARKVEEQSRAFDLNESIKEVGEQKRKIETSEKSMRDSSGMTSRGGGDDGIGDTDGSPGDGGTCSFAIKVFNLVDMFGYFHRGAAAWKTDAVSGFALEGGVPFFTYDPRSTGGFECPHVASYTGSVIGSSKKGVLSNYYAGCEPVSEVLATLLGDGIYRGFPWNTSIGYAFRGNNIPRLVFVYTNEFDNSLVRTYYKNTGIARNRGLKSDVSHQRNVMLFPKVQTNGQITFFPVVESAGEIARAPDSTCICNYFNVGGDIIGYFSKIKLSQANTISRATTAITGLWAKYFYPAYPTLDIWNWDGADAHNYGTSSAPNIYNSNVTTAGYSEMAYFDLRRDTWYGMGGYKWSDIWKLITKEQMMASQQPGNSFNGWYNSGGWHIGINYAQTPGFFKLQKVVGEMTDPTQVFLFVGDADAPRIVECGGDIGNVSMPSQYYDVFSQVFGQNVSNGSASCDWSGITKKNGSAATDADKNNVAEVLVGKNSKARNCLLSWECVYMLNLGSVYTQWKNNEEFWENSARGADKISDWTKYRFGNEEDARAIQGVFGLQNPFKTHNIVWAIRDRGNKYDTDNVDASTISAYSKKYKWVYLIPAANGLSNTTEYAKPVWWTETLANKHLQAGWTNTRYSMEQWKTNYNNCRYSLDLNHCCIVLSNISNATDHKNNSDIRLLQITSIIPANSIRWDKVEYPVETGGDRFNKYSFSNDLVIEDVTTINFSPAVGGGSLKIVAFTTRQVYGDNGYLHGFQQFGHHPYYSGTVCIGLGNSNGRVAKPEGYRGHGPDRINNLNEHTLAAADGQYVGGHGLAQYKTTLPILFRVFYNGTQGTAGPGCHGQYPHVWLHSAALNSKQQLEALRAYQLQTITDEVALHLSQLYDYYCKTLMEDLYTNLKDGMPAMMAYRYQTQIFDKLYNGANGGTCVTDYEDEENPVTFKALPVMDFDAGLMHDIMSSDVFDKTQLGNAINTSIIFKYPQCVIDLTPNLDPATTPYKVSESDESSTQVYLTDTTKFPITFTSGINPNEGDAGNPDAYKKNKILMNRVAAFSEDKEISFSMGSRRADYDVINNPYKIMYRDEDSITSRAVDDYATVRLYTSGSYQKKDSFWDIQKPAPNTNPNKKKYKKNKHFYIDPFELTIAQWCYAHGWHKSHPEAYNSSTPVGRKRCARYELINNSNGVGQDNFNEMERSYWKYLIEWEENDWIDSIKEWAMENTNDSEAVKPYYDANMSKYQSEWNNSFKAEYKRTYLISNPDKTEAQAESAASYALSHLTSNQQNERTEYIYRQCASLRFGKTDEYWYERFLSLNWYNPLEDTRPYYYATYNDVRGTTQVYTIPPRPSTIPASDWKWSSYVINSTNGDEFQMNTSTGTTSFIDILNNKVVMGAYGRNNYVPHADGGQVIELNGNAVDGWSAKRAWYSGLKAGLNFDLPTEAEWEYCCRQGDTFAFPVGHNLGENMEEEDKILSQIAWYKYKDIGRLPEPEKFVTWRISKMLFGITKDPEQVNNVYETTTD